ncbi:MAG: hypothetical protein DYG89_28060 [Caldilinea sp. CFX5]|nr:hypothetical protein [Caldilinea sp. CFX5]
MISREKQTSVLPAGTGGATHRHSPEHTIRHTYAVWMRRFPRWVNAGFNEDFLLRDALPQLRAMLTNGCQLTPAQLAQIWATAFGIPQERIQRMMAECTPVAADFLMRLQIDYCTP